ncbi:hypothetical protein EV207_11965 [Scopulibacillus darangshiensis]|uniref:Hydrolase n=1 Tax=Scopulibacillus darangshiensis TaxID=442528 RepID=A0A4R2NYD0_9BACL|nr:hydrolase [Scopulibacillus darangshiensis]TCP26634.1 hypothetical protein EV207_11965 [Scopulibacillus darangshiensis]
MSYKRRYYITVGSGEILPERTMSEWEFEIDASEEEVMQLQSMFEEANTDSWEAYWRAHIPILPYHHDDSNDKYDDDLVLIYQKLYDLGTPETKEHIKSMGILKEDGQNN